MRNKYFKIIVSNILILYFIEICILNVGVFAAEDKNFLDISSLAAVVIDYNTGRVLYDKNADEQRKIASLTKVMTSIMLVESCDMSEQIEVPADATWIGGSTVGLKKGDMVTAKSLLYGMLLPSGNDCAYTVGFHIGGSIENFAVMMTNKARSIGALNTKFANPHGLDNEEHYSTAKDMALIARYALNNKYINEAVNTNTATINFGSFSKLLKNTNALLRTYDYADGVKTGFTNGANRCLIASATKSDKRFISVILGAETTQLRFGEAKELLEACFAKYNYMDISKYLNFYIKIPVYKGNIKYYERKMSDTLVLPLTQEEYDSIYIKQDIIENIEPPMQKGTKIGDIKVYIDEEIIYEKEVLLEEDIYKKTVYDYIKEGLLNMFKERSTL